MHRFVYTRLPRSKHRPGLLLPSRAVLGDNALPMHRSARRVASLLCGFAAASSLAGAELLPETELVSNCYNFPESIFGLDNSIKATYGASPHLLIPLGDPAVDFTLHDTDGNRWNLGEVLEAGQGKPVVLIFGMRSCPAYEGLDSGEDSTNKWAYWHERALVEANGDKAIFVHVYGPEPHPLAPDRNFDSGKVLANYWSVWRQPVTYGDRLEQAKAIRSLTHPDQVILPDYLTGNPYSSLIQPVWCTYANGARPAVVIASRGHVFYQQGWLNTDDLARSIEVYWEQDGKGTWQHEDDIPSPLSPRRRNRKNAKSGEGEPGQP